MLKAKSRILSAFIVAKLRFRIVIKYEYFEYLLTDKHNRFNG